MKHVLITALIALVVAVVAVLADRSLRPPVSSVLDEEYEALQEQLARSQAERDSLNRLVVAQTDSLQNLQTDESLLNQRLADLQQEISRQDRQLTQLRQRLTHVPSNDTLLRDLNRIARMLHAGQITADSLP